MNVVSGIVDINTCPCCTLRSPTVSTSFGGVFGGGRGEGEGEGEGDGDGEGVTTVVVAGGCTTEDSTGLDVMAIEVSSVVVFNSTEVDG